MYQLKLLSEHQVFGENNLLAIRAQGGKSYVSDFCLGLGSWGDSLTNHTNIGPALVNGRGYNNGSVWSAHGGSNNCGEDDPKYSIRPVIEGEDAKKLYESETEKKIEKINGHFLEVLQYGTYPQNVEWNYGELESRFQKGTLQRTGRIFTLNAKNVAEGWGYTSKVSHEFKLNDQRYVRAIVSSFADCLYLDGKRACNGYPCWYRVQPVEWLCDPTGTLISRHALVAGIPYSEANRYVISTLSKEINNRYPTQRERYKERSMSSKDSDTKKNDRVEKILSARNMTFDEKVQALCRLGGRER